MLCPASFQLASRNFPFSSDLLFPVTKKTALTPALSRCSNIMLFHSSKAYPGMLFVIPSSNVKLMVGCAPADSIPARNRKSKLWILICDNLAKSSDVSPLCQRRSLHPHRSPFDSLKGPGAQAVNFPNGAVLFAL